MTVLAVLVAVGCGKEKDKDGDGTARVDRLLSDLDTNAFHLTMTGFSGKSYDLTFHTSDSTMSGRSTESDKPEDVQYLMSLTQVSEDDSGIIFQALSTTTISDLPSDECEKTGTDYDGDFANLDLGDTGYSNHPETCHVLDMAGTPTLEAALLQVFAKLQRYKAVETDGKTKFEPIPL